MKNNKNLRKWLDDMNLPHPLFIAGPCSAETENQVLDIAHQLKDSDRCIQSGYETLEPTMEILKVLGLWHYNG